MIMSEDDENEGIIESYLRASLERAKDDSDEAEPHPLLMYIDDPQARNAVGTTIEALNRDPEYPDFDDTALPNLIAQTSGSESLYDAFENQNVSKIAYHRGMDNRNNTYYNISEYIRDEWRQRIDGNAVHKVLVVGDEGAGKTDWMIEEANKGAEVVHSKTDKKVIGVGNADLVEDSSEFDEWYDVSSTPTLDNILEQNYREDTEIIVVLDEGDQLFGGFGQSQVSARELGDRIKLFRKYNAHILMTSQRQVAPDLRNRMQIRHKPDDTNPERLVIAESVDSEGQPEDIILKGQVPATDVDYDTLDIADWEHNPDDEDEDDRVEQLEEAKDEMETEANRRLWLLYDETDMSYREVGEKVGLSKKQAYDRVKKYKENNNID